MSHWYFVYAHVLVLYKSKTVKVVQIALSVYHLRGSEIFKFKLYARGPSAYLCRIQMIGELQLSQLHLYTMHYFHLLKENQYLL